MEIKYNLPWEVKNGSDLYKFRTVENLIGKYQELEKQ